MFFEVIFLIKLVVLNYFVFFTNALFSGLLLNRTNSICIYVKAWTPLRPKRNTNRQKSKNAADENDGTKGLSYWQTKKKKKKWKDFVK